MKKLIIFTSVCIFLSCSSLTPYSFVVQRNVPDNPTIAIDSGSYALQNMIEEIIIEMGIKLYIPPTVRSTKEEVAKTGADIGTIAMGSKSVVYSQYTTNADYVIEITVVNATQCRIRLIKIKDFEILSAFNYTYKGNNLDVNFDGKLNLKLTLYDLFKKSGFKLKDVYMNYMQAVKYLSGSGIVINNMEDWKKYCASNNRPFYIPANPDETFAFSGWVSWEKWFSDIKKRSQE